VDSRRNGPPLYKRAAPGGSALWGAGCARSSISRPRGRLISPEHPCLAGEQPRAARNDAVIAPLDGGGWVGGTGNRQRLPARETGPAANPRIAPACLEAHPGSASPPRSTVNCHGLRSTATANGYRRGNAARPFGKMKAPTLPGRERSRIALSCLEAHSGTVDRGRRP